MPTIHHKVQNTLFSHILVQFISPSLMHFSGTLFSKTVFAHYTLPLGFISCFKVTHSTQIKCMVLMVNQSHSRPKVPWGFQVVIIPRLCDNGPEWW